MRWWTARTVYIINMPMFEWVYSAGEVESYQLKREVWNFVFFQFLTTIDRHGKSIGPKLTALNALANFHIMSEGVVSKFYKLINKLLCLE